MKQAYVFPGQGSPSHDFHTVDYGQQNPQLCQLLDDANAIFNVDFSSLEITSNTDLHLRDALIIQPLLFLSSMVDFLLISKPQPDMVAGHSLGEFAALVAAKAITSHTALQLLKARASAMQRACEMSDASSMVAVMGLRAQIVQSACDRVNERLGSHVVIANFNSEFQVVISGETDAINAVIESLQKHNPKSIVHLKVGGAFHSPLMEAARDEFAQMVNKADIQNPVCPIYLNSTTTSTMDPGKIREHLKDQITQPVRWYESIQAMVADGATQFYEFGPGNVLQKLIRKINGEVVVGSASHNLLAAKKGDSMRAPLLTEMECHLQELWAALLPRVEQNDIRADDSFFHLGGDSILAIRLAQLAREKGLKLSAADVLSFPQLSVLAQRIAKIPSDETQIISPYSLLKDDGEMQRSLLYAAKLCDVKEDFIEDILPCTPLQEGLLALTSRKRNSYVSQNVLHVASNTDIEQLKRCWNTVLESMPVLRSRIIDLPGQGLVQVVIKEDAIWSLCDSIESYCAADNQIAMGLATPLSRQAVFKDGNRVSIIWTVHHAVYDGWTMNMFFNNLRQLYGGGPIPRIAPFHNLIKYIIESKESMEKYWTEVLQDLEAPQFPSLPGSAYQSLADDMIIHRISGLDWKQVDVTAATVIRAAWAVLSARYTDSNDVVFGATVIGRQAPVPGIESMSGPTIATVPIRVLTDPNIKVHELLRELHQQAVEMVSMEQMGLQNIARLNAETARACQFQTLLVVQPKGMDNRNEPGPEIFEDTKVGKDDARRALKAFNNYACMVECVMEETNLEIRINFDTRTLDSQQVHRMAEQFEHLIRLFCSNSTASTRLSELNLANASDLSEIWTWNKEVPPMEDAVVHDLIMQRAALQPNAPAVCAWDGDFSYEKLDHISTLTARHLVKRGVVRGSLVPLCFEKSKWTVVSMLAVMKAGGTSVAMDSTQPEARLRTIVHLANPSVIMTSRPNSELATRLYESSETIVVSESLMEKLSAEPATPLPVVEPSDGLYVVFTSGSTGTPKGCMVSHASFSSAIRYQSDALRYSTETRLFDFVSYAFDVTWPNSLQTLSAGGCLCVPSEHERRNDISRVIQRLHVNSVHIPTSVARLIDPTIASGLRTVVLGGESLTMSDRTRWGSDVEVIQVYGPAECTPPIAAAYFHDEQADMTDIGKGVGVNLWLVDPHDHTKLAGIGMVGEILVEGPLVGQGYLHDSDRTEASFIEDPQWLVNGTQGVAGRRGKLYKTGDLGRYSSGTKGTILFIGRKDAQVKIRGQRVELGDVEHHVQENITSNPGILVVADKVTPKGSSNAILVVFVPLGKDADVASHRRSALNAATAGVNDRLASKLPAYMIPSAYVPVSELPKTATGKTDRRRLRELGSSFSLEEMLELNAAHQPGKGRVPSPGLETDLQRLWAQVLGIDEESICAEHSFLRIGGDSIGAMRLVAAAKEDGISFSAAEVFETPVLSDLAQAAKRISEVKEEYIAPFSLLGANTDLDEVRTDAALQCEVEVHQIEDIYPCTPLQEGLLSETVKQPGLYTARKVFEVPIQSSFEKLENAIQRVVREIPMLRTRIVDLSGQGLVQVVPTQNITCLYSDNLEEYLLQDSRQPFGLQIWLTRFGLIHQMNKKFLVWTIHHALYDGWSRPLMLKQIELAFCDQPLLKLSPIQPFIRHIQKMHGKSPAVFWKEYFHDLEAVMFPEMPSKTYRCRAKDSSTLTLANIAWPTTGITASTVVRLAWAMVQSAWTNTSDVVFGVMTTGRQAPVPDIQQTAGPTFATIPTRIVIDSSLAVGEMLQHVQTQSLKALAYEQTGLQYIKRYSPSTERACGFQTLLVVQPPQNPEDLTSIFRLASAQQDQGLNSFNSYALMLECKLEKTGLIVEVSFDSKIISRIQVDRMLQQFSTALDSLCKNDSVAIRHINVASEEDLVAAWTWNGKEHEPFKTLFQDQFSQRVLEQGNAPAICAWDGELSYTQLDQMSTSLAYSLFNLGLGPGVIAGLYFEKSKWMSVAALAVFKTGGAYVAMDDTQPQERLRTILEISTATVLVSSAQNRERASQLVKDLAINHELVLDGLVIEKLPMSGYNIMLERPNPSDPMIIQFTSGSTGTPKGAILTYQNVSSFIHYLQDDLGFTRYKRVYDFASYAFDSAWANLVNTLSSGGCLCVPSRSERDNNLTASVASFNADMVILTSTVGRQLLAEGPPESLRWIAYGGEKVTEEEVRPLGHVKAVNCYAPCECTCIAVVGPKLSATVNNHEISCLGFGRGTNTWIVDANCEDRLAPIGAIGELWLEGPLVGLGYIGDEERTAAAWFEDPPWLLRGSSKHRGRRGRLYRTGDLVQYNEDGSLFFKGRKDAQVKLRGQRVELEEVEHHVLANLHDNINLGLAAEVFRPQGSNEPLLGVFVAVGPSVYTSLTKTREHLRTILEGVDARLSEKIPSYMVPSVYIPIMEIPLTVTSKKNRLKLREVGSSLTMEQIADMNPWRKHKRRPTTLVEKQMQRLWAAVLGLEESSIGADDDFLRIGGDSIAAMRLVSAARKQGLHFTVAQIFSTPQLCKLAATLKSKDIKEVVIAPFSMLHEDDGRADFVKKAAASCRVPETKVEDIYPCTPLQEGMLALTAKDSDSKAYIARFVYDLDPSTDIDRFRSAWDRLYELTPILRTRIVDLGRVSLAQVVLREEVPWSEFSLNEAESGKHMQLGTALSRCRLSLRPSGTKPRFEWLIHHVLYDGWMLGLLHERLQRLYNGEKLAPPPPIQPFIRDVLGSETPEALDFWTKQFEGSTASPFPILPSQGYQPQPTERVSQRVNKIHWPRNTGITQSSYIQASWAVLSACYTNADEAIFGVTVSGRNSSVPGIEDMLSPTIATFPCRIVLDRDNTVAALLQQVQSQSVSTIPFAQTGLNRIRRISSEIESASQFQSLLLVNVERTSIEKNRPPALLRQVVDRGNSEPSKTDNSAFSTYAMTVQCDISHERMYVHIDFDASVITIEQVDRIGLQFQQILQQLCISASEASSKPLSAIDIVPKSDLLDLWAWNNRIPPPVNETVHSLFGAWVRKQPRSPAICAWDGGMTYEELDRRTTKLACHLSQNELVRRGDIVPLGFDKSLWAVVAILGVMKAGGASVLVDASQPQQRLRSVLERVKARLILCSENHKETLSKTWDCITQVIDENVLQENKDFARACLPEVQPSDLLYVSFTSGSTGQPKGVVVHHTHFSSAIRYQHRSLGYEASSSRVYDFASYSFDISWSNMLQALGSGACICIPSEEERKNDIVGSFNKLRANMVDLTPSISRTLSPESLPGLRTLITGGEAVLKEDVVRWSGEGRRLIVAYGPAETTPTSTVTELLPEKSRHNIGFGVGCCSWVVDPLTEQLTFIGGVGELWTEGPIVCAGYLEEPDKTASAFVEDPPWLLKGDGASHPGRRGRLYKTGDLVRFNMDGSLEFISRKDDQVKIRGQRIELIEIEQTIERCLFGRPTKGQVLVEKIIPKGSQNPILAAFVPIGSIGKEGSIKDGIKVMQEIADGLEEGLSEVLPGYMLPSAYIPVDRIPVTISGKKDRKNLKDIGRLLSLEELSEMHVSRRDGRHPANEVERQFQQLFADILGIDAESVKATDNFFRIGGDSITAMRLCVAARERCYSLTVADVLQNPHLEDLAAHALHSVTTLSRGPVSTTSIATDVDKSEDSWPSSAPDTSPSSTVLPVTDFQSLCIKAALKQPPEWWNAFYIEFSSTFSHDKILDACRQLWQSYDILRTVFSETGGVYQQCPSDQSGPNISVLHTSSDLQNFSHQLRTDLLQRPTSLGQSFAKFVFTCHIDGQAQLTVQLSHALYDGISLGNMMQSFAAFLQDQRLPLQPSFSSFIRSNAVIGDRGHQYWRSLLLGSSITRVPPSDAGGNGILSLRRTLPLIAPQESATAATVFTAACAKALSMVTNQSDVVLGRLVSGRSSNLLSAPNTVGPCINFVPVRLHFYDNLIEDNEHGMLVSAIRSVQDQFLQSLPYETVGLHEIASTCTEWQKGLSLSGGDGDHIGFGFTVQYETHDDDPSVQVLGEHLTLKWHRKPAEALYDGCIAVTARQEARKLRVTVTGSESRLSAMQDILDLIGSFL